MKLIQPKQVLIVKSLIPKKNRLKSHYNESVKQVMDLLNTYSAEDEQTIMDQLATQLINVELDEFDYVIKKVGNQVEAEPNVPQGKIQFVNNLNKNLKILRDTFKACTEKIEAILIGQNDPKSVENSPLIEDVNKMIVDFGKISENSDQWLISKNHSIRLALTAQLSHIEDNQEIDVKSNEGRRCALETVAIEQLSKLADQKGQLSKTSAIDLIGENTSASLDSNEANQALQLAIVTPLEHEGIRSKGSTFSDAQPSLWGTLTGYFKNGFRLPSIFQGLADSKRATQIKVKTENENITIEITLEGSEEVPLTGKINNNGQVRLESDTSEFLSSLHIETTEGQQTFFETILQQAGTPVLSNIQVIPQDFQLDKTALAVTLLATMLQNNDVQQSLRGVADDARGEAKAHLAELSKAMSAFSETAKMESTDAAQRAQAAASREVEKVAIKLAKTLGKVGVKAVLNIASFGGVGIFSDIADAAGDMGEAVCSISEALGEVNLPNVNINISDLGIQVDSFPDIDFNLNLAHVNLSDLINLPELPQLIAKHPEIIDKLLEKIPDEPEFKNLKNVLSSIKDELFASANKVTDAIAISSKAFTEQASKSTAEQADKVVNGAISNSSKQTIRSGRSEAARKRYSR